MEEHDVVVIGSGSASHVVDRALADGLDVGWIDRGPVGGTCMNLGCVPSKMLISVADRVSEIRESGRLGIDAEISGVDFGAVMSRMREAVERRRRGVLEGIRHSEGLRFYRGTARFTGERTLRVNDHEVHGGKVFVASGARPLIPQIDGLDEIDYLTNETVLEIEALPESVVIVGGGYVGVEYAHFLSAMGAHVTLIQRDRRLVPNEEEDVSWLLAEKLAERMDVRTGITVTGVRPAGTRYTVTGSSEGGDGDVELPTDAVFMAAGRRSNADLLGVEAAGIETTESGYIAVSDRLETSAEGVWAFGDIIGRSMFTHAAVRESIIAWHNATHDDPITVDHATVPHAVFSHPQIASVGITEAEARTQGLDYLVGRREYSDVMKGEGLMIRDGFAKAIVGAKDRRILGFHVIGPYAPILIQEVVNAMVAGHQPGDVAAGLHIHPALTELVVETLTSVASPEHVLEV